MTKQPASIYVQLPRRGNGQHLAYFLGDLNGPDLFVGDRIRARKHSSRGVKALYLAEYWGESASFQGNGAAKLDAATAASDWPWLLDDEVAQIFSGHCVVIVDGDQLTMAGSDVDMKPHAAIMRFHFTGDRWKGEVEIMVPARHPVAYATIEMRPHSLLPINSPIPISLTAHGMQPISAVAPLLSCRCVVVSSLRALVQIPNPERDLARYNAVASPHFAAAVEGLR